MYFLLPTTYYVLFFSILSTFYSPLYSYPPGWSDDILLTPEDNKIRFHPDIDVDGFNNVWAVWDSTTWANGTGEVLYSKRDSLGSALISETDVSNNATYSLGPRIAVDASNNVQFIWHDETPLGIGVWHAKLANDGSVHVSSHLAVSGNNDLFPYDIVLNKYQEINIVWDELSGNNIMNFTKLDSLGNPIITKIQVSSDACDAYYPGIDVDSMANIHLGYRTDTATATDRLTYTKLDKDGNVIISNKILGYGALPSMICDRSQNIHITYGDPTGPGNSIKYLKINQSGNILVGPKTLSVHEENARPHMAMDSMQYLHVVWDFDNMIDTIGIMYTKLDTIGNFIIPPMKIVYPPYTPGCGMPRIAVDTNNHLHLVWVDGRLNPGVSTDIFYKRGENEQTVAEMRKLNEAERCQIIARPNPFATRTAITFPLSRENEKGIMKIYDALGRSVRDYAIGRSDKMIIWDGTGNDGHRLPDGVYFIRLQDSGFSQSVMIILLRQ